MAQYELSNDPVLLEQAERLCSLEGRAFPTLVVSWESRMLGQDWDTVLVQDYTIALPPLEHGSSFNEVRISAFTGPVPTKFLYFGTELNAAAPRTVPEMENTLTSAGVYQEYRLTGESCPVPYLELISTTPRIYGNGPQDYYSPPIKVERFDAVLRPELIGDNFPKIVANLDVIPGEVLTDPSEGSWIGARFVGQKKLAILRQGKVVGFRRRSKRTESQQVIPPEVVRRQPQLDVRDVWVAIDFGTVSTVMIVGDGERTEVIPVGLDHPLRVPADLESPSEIAFENLDKIIKAWQERASLPLIEWGDVFVGHAARRLVHGDLREQARRTKASLRDLALLPSRIERGENVAICGAVELNRTITLRKPALPVFDEDGISPDDPFDPIELYAYYLGIHLNTRKRGIHLRYAIGMPTGWEPVRREQVLAQLRRGLFRSLPAGMVSLDDFDALKVVDAGPNVLSFAAAAFRVFGILPRGEAIPFVAVDAGATETAVLCGAFRDGLPDEVGAGYERIVEHVKPIVFSEIAGERYLHGLAYRVYAASGTSMRNNAIPFTPPSGEPLLSGHEERLVHTFDANVNSRILMDVVRSILESPVPLPLPDSVGLFGADGQVHEVRVLIDRVALSDWLKGEFMKAAELLKGAVLQGFQQITRAEPPFAAMRVLLGGRLSMNPHLQECFEAVLPSTVRFHKFREPDETNLNAPTVKLATAYGILALRYQPLQPAAVKDERGVFGWRVGRGKQGMLKAALDGQSGYDVWREFGPCTRPDVCVFYTAAGAHADDVPVDAPGVRSITCDVGFDAVGYRLYVRAVGLSHVELSVGPPGGRPSDGAVTWGLELTQGFAVPVSRR